MNPPITYSRINLSQEQRRVLALLAEEGCTHEEAAHRLQKSRITIARMIREIRELLGVESVYQVIAIAVSRGWIRAPRKSGDKRE